MISKQEILSLATSQGLLPTTVEKDYALSWVLYGISHHPQLAAWLFNLKTAVGRTFQRSQGADFGGSIA